MKNPRRIAAEALLRIHSQEGWSNLVLDSMLERSKLEPRDKAFVGALVYGVLERLVTLDACINTHSKQPVERLSPAVRETLRLGIFQLLFLDSVPDSAAVNESVELVKQLKQGHASGFVNGVLRAFLRAEKRIPFPAGPVSARWSVEYACPEPLIRLWIESYGQEAALRVLKESLGRPPLCLRVNTLLISPDELISRLAAHGVKAEQDGTLPACLTAEHTGAIHHLPEYRRGFFHAQDRSSQMCAFAVDARPGMRVLDACAAPGGKSFTLAQLMEGKGEIVAADLHPTRVKLVANRAKQMKLATIVRAVEADMTLYDETLGQFDRVLCDVPCSGLGVIRRKPEIRRKPLSEYENLPGIQYKILETASQYCKAGGRLIYSTCTLNPAENEAVADRFSREHPDFDPAPLPDFLGGGSARTLLGEFDADGFFLAAFVRRDAPASP